MTVVCVVCISYLELVKLNHLSISNSQGSSSMTENNNFLEPAFASDLPLYNVQLQCTRNSSLTVPFPVLSVAKAQGKSFFSLF